MKKLNNNFIIIFFTAFIIFGISLIKDFGVSFDEGSNRLYGLVNGNYILKTFLPKNRYENIFKNITSEKFSEKIQQKKPTDLHEFPDRAYGVIFELPVTAIEMILNFNSNNEVYLYRHLMTFLLYSISLIFFYLLLKKIFKNKLLSFLGVLFLITHPRIFANSFYNSKDIVFLSFFIITTYFGYSYLLKKKFKNLLFFCFFSACSINLRAIGFVLPLMVYSNIVAKNFNFNNFIKKDSLLIPILTVFFLYIIWPFIWNDPINNFIYVITWFKEIPINIINYYNGSDLNALNTPWHYLLTWFTITTPSYLLISIILGSFILLKNIVYKINNIKFLIQILLFLLILPVLLAIVLNIALYDGWRHFYFISPFLIIICILCFEQLFKKINLWHSKLLIAFLCLLFLKNIYNLYQLHPHQFLYFNKDVIKNPLEKFEKDYWGLTNKIVLDNFLDKIDRKEIIYGFTGSMLPLSIEFIDKLHNRKFKHYCSVKKNEIRPFYFFANNRYHPPYDFLKKHGSVIYEYKLDNVTINGVYEFESLSKYTFLANNYFDFEFNPLNHCLAN